MPDRKRLERLDRHFHTFNTVVSVTCAVALVTCIARLILVPDDESPALAGLVALYACGMLANTWLHRPAIGAGDAAISAWMLYLGVLAMLVRMGSDAITLEVVRDGIDTATTTARDHSINKGVIAGTATVMLHIAHALYASVAFAYYIGVYWPANFRLPMNTTAKRACTNNSISFLTVYATFSATLTITCTLIAATLAYHSAWPLFHVLIEPLALLALTGLFGWIVAGYDRGNAAAWFMLLFLEGCVVGGPVVALGIDGVDERCNGRAAAQVSATATTTFEHLNDPHCLPRLPAGLWSNIGACIVVVAWFGYFVATQYLYMSCMEGGHVSGSSECGNVISGTEEEQDVEKRGSSRVFQTALVSV